MKVSFGKRSHREVTTDLDDLPVTVERRSGPLMGVFICVFALLWGGFPMIGLAMTGAEAEPEFIWIASIFPACTRWAW